MANELVLPARFDDSIGLEEHYGVDKELILTAMTEPGINIPSSYKDTNRIYLNPEQVDNLITALLYWKKTGKVTTDG